MTKIYVHKYITTRGELEILDVTILEKGYVKYGICGYLHHHDYSLTLEEAIKVSQHKLKRAIRSTESKLSRLNQFLENLSNG